ncbi:hypothetical protein HQ865_21325 [Mucilaginibacter mali]|uniref:Addiction module component n=1 Tax=Mucilaginibacter mali TaxID=2740462 RepID=A0A7D4TXA2_9SPHI|nr:hypothetical protein [Mucilaginibacter mali]QKJ32195.1 hypothetical protein HQ865_21325 [Mucilaginibacter mali]
MTIAALREHIHKAVDNADEKILESVYALLEDQGAEPYEWSEDEEFVAELNERVRRAEEGIDRTYSLDEIKTSFERWEKEHSGSTGK